MDIKGAIALAAKLAILALQVGADAMPFIKKIQEWNASQVPPTQATVDELNAQEQPFLDALNDTSRDDV